MIGRWLGSWLGNWLVAIETPPPTALSRCSLAATTRHAVSLPERSARTNNVRHPPAVRSFNINAVITRRTSVSTSLPRSNVATLRSVNVTTKQVLMAITATTRFSISRGYLATSKVAPRRSIG